MRGGHVHNTVLMAPLITACRELGIAHHIEAPARLREGAGSIDLLIEGEREFGSIAIEAECSGHRVGKDICKALAVNATDLWIVVPTGQVRRAIDGALGRAQGRPGQLIVSVLTLRQAQQRLRVYFPLISASKEQGKE